MQAIKKTTLPNIPQKLPILEIIKPTAERINNIQPKIFILLSALFFGNTLPISALDKIESVPLINLDYRARINAQKVLSNVDSFYTDTVDVQSVKDSANDCAVAVLNKQCEDLYMQGIF